MTEQTEREVLEALFADIHDGKSARWLDHYGEPELSAKGRRFNALMGLNAYHDAAMMLVPEGFEVDLTIGKYWPCRARLVSITKDGDRWLHRGSDPHYCENAATPALALCAAIRAAKDAAP